MFYDPEALVEPVRIVRYFAKTSDFTEGEPYVFPECIQTIFPVNGLAIRPVAPGTALEFEVPDMYGRPWAQIWEKYWEEGMQHPSADEDIFSFEYGELSAAAKLRERAVAAFCCLLEATRKRSRPISATALQRTPLNSKAFNEAPGMLAVDGTVAVATPSKACMMATPSIVRAMPAGRNQAAKPTYHCRHDQLGSRPYRCHRRERSWSTR